jgi:hypothetical protein
MGIVGTYRLVLIILACANFSIRPCLASQVSAAERQEALKVIRFLEKIEFEEGIKRPGPLKRENFTESELNSYIAYRIETEKEDVMKELTLKLFEKNRVEGKMFIDLSGQKLPPVLKPQMNVYFEGVLTVQNGQARFDFQKLFVEGQQVPVVILDLIIFVAANLGKSEPGSINDWYELPPGIKDLRTDLGRILVYY